VQLKTVRNFTRFKLPHRLMQLEVTKLPVVFLVASGSTW